MGKELCFTFSNGYSKLKTETQAMGTLRFNLFLKIVCVLIALSCVFTITIFISSCKKERPPWKVGFSGTLTGPFSELGVHGRNGLILKIEEVNQRGGVKGRPIELIIKDDRHDPKEALRVDQELIDLGVVAIIGHMTSAMTLSVMSLVEKEKILLISPTTSTPLLSKKDDLFIRVVGASNEPSKAIAKLALQQGLKKVGVLASIENKEYTIPYVEIFKAELEKEGGDVICLEKFGPDQRSIFSSLAEGVLRKGPDAIFIVASGTDTALFCQYIRMSNGKIPIFISGWALTQDLLLHGGRSVEGVWTFAYFPFVLENKAIEQFRQRYQARFNIEPNFASLLAYDAGEVLVRGLETAKEPITPNSLKDAILKIRRFESPSGPFELDEYGDPTIRYQFVKVEKGRFVSTRP